MSVPTSEVLNRAADLIEERGWTVGLLGWRGGGGLCVEGAIAAAAECESNHHTLWACPAYQAVSDYVDRPIIVESPRGWKLRHLFIWNDLPDRTAEQVVEVLRACAVIEASRERQTVETSA